MNRSEVEVDGAADYDPSLKKKVKKYPEKYGNITCEDAHIEKACRVWESPHANQTLSPPH